MLSYKTKGCMFRSPFFVYSRIVSYAAFFLSAADLRVKCVEFQTAREGRVCVFCWKTANLTWLNKVSAALDRQAW